MLFGSSTKHHALELIVNIQSDSVSGTLVSFDDHATVLYTTQAALTATATNNPEALVPAMLTALSYTLTQVTSEGVARVSTTNKGAVIKHSTITFSAPWYTSKVKDIILKKDKQFQFTQKAFDVIVAKQAETEKERSAGNTMIEHDVTHVIINGYELKDPFNKKTNEILMAFYTSFINTETLHKINETIAKALHHVPVTYRTFPLMFFTTIRDMFWNIDRFTVFDIGSSVTEISIVEGGAITHIASIPTGSQQLIQKVEASCSMNTQTLASTIAMLARGDMDPSCNQNVLAALTAAQKKWVTEVQTALVDQGGISLPQRIFISTNTAVAPVFKQLFTTIETRKNLFGTDQELQVALLTPDHFRKYITVSEDYSVSTSTAITMVFLQATK
jgi:hypothetical protein